MSGVCPAVRRLIVDEQAEGFARYGMSDPIELDTCEYMGPFQDGQIQTIWARLPNGGLTRITSPPWVFRECADFSLEIRESIWFDKDGSHDWHGYLDEGYVWREL